MSHSGGYDDRRRSRRNDYSDSEDDYPRTSKSDRSGGHHRSRRYDSLSSEDESDYRKDRRRSSRRDGNVDGAQIGQAAQAAFTAAAMEAWKARKAPGGWTGEKGRRILTAAASAGAVDKAQDRNPDKHGLQNVLTSAIGGLATSRLANGPQERSRSRGGHGRSRSVGNQDRGLKDIAAGVITAGLGKKIYDERSRSRGPRRDRDRGYTSSDSEDDIRSRRSRGNRKNVRSRSITDQFRDRIADGLASVGLTDVAKKVETRDDRNPVLQRSRSTADAAGAGATAGAVSRRRRNSNASRSSHGASGNGTDPEKSDYDSDVAKRKHRKLREKELLNGALATVATVHSVHSLMEAKEARQRRHNKVINGELTPAQAKVEARKATAKDLATIGIAAYGAKGAYSAWKEMTEKHKEVQEFDKHAHECRKQRVEKNREEIARLNRQVQELNTNQQRLLGSGEYVRSPTYNDANPYAGMVPPEVSYSQHSQHY